MALVAPAASLLNVFLAHFLASTLHLTIPFLSLLYSSGKKRTEIQNPKAFSIPVNHLKILAAAPAAAAAFVVPNSQPQAPPLTSSPLSVCSSGQIW